MTILFVISIKNSCGYRNISIQSIRVCRHFWHMYYFIDKSNWTFYSFNICIYIIYIYPGQPIRTVKGEDSVLKGFFCSSNSESQLILYPDNLEGSEKEDSDYEDWVTSVSVEDLDDPDLNIFSFLNMVTETIMKFEGLIMR